MNYFILTLIDTYSKVVCSKLYLAKNAITAADHLNDMVVPFFDSHDIPLLRIMTDRGTESCGKIEHYEYQLYLAIENIDHAKIKARSPQTNGLCERLHKTVLHEFYMIAFRKKVYNSLDELQADFDIWIKHSNEERPHTGKYCYGKTPMKTFLVSKHIAKDKQLDSIFQISSRIECVR